ncbi:MAG: gluconolactonase [Lachnospiraceae bacterium]|nr:gluconolactonase [Lachnospiraceae bacterium]
MNKRIKSIVLAAILILGIMVQDLAAFATTVPYDSYNYDYWDDIVYTPAPFIPYKSFGGDDFKLDGTSIGKFSSPQDVYVAEDGVYVCDTGNKRIVKLSLDLKSCLEIIDNAGGTAFDQPYGVYVSSQNWLYIAEKTQKCVWVLDENREVQLCIKDPKSEIIGEGFDFTPLKVSVDYANRVYVVCAGKTEGILVFDSEGNFTSFFGTISVTISVWERIWRKLSTKAQRAKQVLYIPTEFTNLDVDPDGFVYTTNIDSAGTQAVMKLNPKGQDVIRLGEKGKIAGDLSIDGSGDYAGASRIVDVVYRGHGIYTVLDQKRGRVFTYDSEGNMLYIFGGLGSQEGTFNMPVAVEELGNKIIVLDAGRNELMLFNQTEYGALIDEAVGLRYDGDEAQAVEIWKKVLKLDENYELANDGIGKAYLTAGDNAQAMKYLKLAMDKKYYSIAFRRYRNEWLKKNLGGILTGLIVLIVVIVVLKNVINKKRGKSVVKEGLL